MNFASQWLERFGLSSRNWAQEAAQHIDGLPFISGEVAFPLVEFLFAEVPAIVSSCNDPRTTQLANAYAWCCFAFWQCESPFPALPENYAAHLKVALSVSAPERDRSSQLLARMIVDFNAGEGACGFNRLAVTDAEVIRDSERRNIEGDFDVFLKTPQKYEEYLKLLEDSAAFQEEWSLIKANYGYFLANKPIIRRSSIPERNWLRGNPGAQFNEARYRFKAVFDFFCWKYFLWGMEGDKPLLLKVSAVCTPHGTQIFIPGYLSIDIHRDLNFPEIMALHKARGIPRQGPGHSVGRRERAELHRKAKELDAEARSMGLKGDARYSFVAERINYPLFGDLRRVRAIINDEERRSRNPVGAKAVKKKR
jgi:hypothetical protein